MLEYNPLQKRGSILLHCNVFDPQKHCGTTTFFCDFGGDNMFPCQPQKQLCVRYIFQKGFLHQERMIDKLLINMYLIILVINWGRFPNIG